MKQLLQHLGDGRTIIKNVPAPALRSGHLLIRTETSLISAGTERMLLQFGKAGWLGKARQQPERLREVFAKIRAQGLCSTITAIRSKLDQPIPLGYCNVGRVVEAGPVKPDRNDASFSRGDRVVSNGSHAQVVAVTQSLCAKVPESVSDVDASFTPLASIALEGIDLMHIEPGNKVVVTGLGLIGQLAVRILKAMGCEVLGVDPSAERRELGRQHGATVVDSNDDPVRAAMSFSQGEGVAGVLITASASTHEIVSQAARSCRRRGRVVLVGVVGLQLNRADFYKNEISFQVACSYGTREGNVPGGAQHNFNRILAMMADQRLSVGNLVTHNYGFLESDRAYEKLSDPTALGIVLDYAPVASAEDELLQRSITLAPITAPASQGLGVIGSGNFAMRTLLPAISEIDDAPPILTVLAHQGVQAVMAAEKFGGAQATTDQDAVFAAKNVSSLLVTTRHDSHARLALRALEYGKHVWVEKPLAMSLEDLERLKTALTANALASPVLMVGFNRRFAPMATKLHAALRQQGKPIRVTMEVNAGQLPRDHWTLDPLAGGGRIVGEGCHFVDLARYLVGQPVAKVSCLRRDTDGQDGAKYALAFADGSLAEIDYRTDLPPHQAKERIELTGEGIGAKIQNWTRLEVTGLSGISGGGGLAGKGHVQALRSFFASHESGVPPVAYDELFEVSAWVIVMQKMAAGEEITAPPGGFSF